MIPKKYATVMSGLVVRWTSDSFSGEINASRDGASMCGPWSILSPAQTREVIAALEDAFNVCQRLKSGDKLDEIPRETLSGSW
jgi:hypothetical protein